jgi:hypothetical protein
MCGEYNNVIIFLCSGTEIFNDVHGNTTKGNADPV